MFTKQAVTVIIIGAVFVVLGLIPSALAGLKHEIRNFRASLSPLPTREVSPDIQSGRLPGQIWLAVAGVAAIGVGILALLYG
jgi:hypothetical protein